jgi:hypothetical protein
MEDVHQEQNLALFVSFELKEELDTAARIHRSKRVFDREFVRPNYQILHESCVQLRP